MTRVYRHTRQVPGLPGESADAVRMAQIEASVAQTQGRFPISADHYSDPNAALTAAGPGGTVTFSAGTTYTAPDGLRVMPGQRLVGADRNTTVIISPAPSVIAVRTPGSTCPAVQISGMEVRGSGGTADIGIDARGMERALIDDVYVNGSTLADAGVWFGGDMTTYTTCWSNTLQRSVVRTPAGGSGIRLAGTVDGSTSTTATANHITVREVYVPFSSTASARGLDVDQGDGNLFEHLDMGYRDGVLPIWLGDQANYNVFHAIRTEDVERIAEIYGDYNRFEACMFGTGGTAVAASPITIHSPALRNSFSDVIISGGGTFPYISEDAITRETEIRWYDGIRTHKPYSYTGTYRPIESQGAGDANKRWYVEYTGAHWWGDGTTAPDTLLYRNAANSLRMGDDDSLRVGSGAWNGGHLQIGVYHLWVDGNGRLRIKSGAPASDTDGTIVGSQS